MIVTSSLQFRTGVGEMIDLSDRVRKAVEEAKIRNGLAVVFVPGATGTVTTIEFEPGLAKDMTDALERLAPQELDYSHNQRWGDGNGHSHVRAAMLGPSLTVPVVDGLLTLGTWQQIVFLELDCRPRDRRLVLQVMGE